MGTPFISVVIPTYNRDAVLPSAIRSVLAQVYQDFEIIVVDDGSTDRTAEVVETLIREDRDLGNRDLRIRYVFQSNKGQSAARNTGIALARGHWTGFLDSDDTWRPEKLDWQMSAIEQCGSGCAACFTDARLVDSLGLDVSAFARAGLDFSDRIGVFQDALRRLALGFGGIWLQTVVARTELIREMGGFDVSLHFAEDHDFLFRLSLITRFAYVNRELAVIDRASQNFDPSVPSRAWDKPDVRLLGEQRRLEKWLELADSYPADVRRTLLRNLRGLHSVWANWYLESDQFAKARQAAAKGISYHFTIQLAFKLAVIWMIPRLAKRIVPRTATIL